MRLAETVTFATSGLDRAAHLRGDAAAMVGLMADPAARVLAIWRGKALVTPDGAAAWLPFGHRVLDTSPEVAVFLGLDDAGPRFATDISGWEPPAVVLPEGAPLPAASGIFDMTEQSHPDAPDDARFAELRAVMTALSPRDAEFFVTAKSLLGWHRSHRFCPACGQPSQPVMAGWQRSCPACGAQHFPRTDPVVIMLITRGNSLLVGRSPGWPEGMYSLLAGFMEPGETIEAAVRREVHEESGIRVGPVRYLASQPWPYPGSLMIGCAGEALEDRITLDPRELEAACWLTREDLAQVFAGEHPTIRAPRSGAIAGFLMRNWLADTLD